MKAGPLAENRFKERLGSERQEIQIVKDDWVLP
jgi:hypothetical protein